jgi:hypothetical protein
MIGNIFLMTLVLLSTSFIDVTAMNKFTPEQQECFSAWQDTYRKAHIKWQGAIQTPEMQEYGNLVKQQKASSQILTDAYLASRSTKIFQEFTALVDKELALKDELANKHGIYVEGLH